MRRIMMTAVFGSLLASSAMASDGVIEINQVTALAGGVTPGDTAGFPVTISTPGSYRLTGNLSVTDPSRGGIVISSAGVTLDLGGFEIAGPGTCSGSGSFLTCTVSSAASGVTLSTLGARSRVMNGTVHGFGAYGVDIGSGTAERLRVTENGAGGIFSTFSSPAVLDSFVERNRGDGLHVLLGIVRNCTVASNFGSGITGTGSLYEGNLVRGNGAYGINADQRAIVRNNVVSGNTADGIVVSVGSLVADNASDLNGQAGISALSTSSIQRNIVQGNNGVGLYLFPEAGGTAAVYRENVVSANTAGTVTSGINLGNNSCNGTATCP